ncbi:MAG: penicillin-binding protein 1C [Chlorogloeopsis fritschii C42_A2020_084]|uniref:penicillin-binding protein 1C n=1 Tax=Chlorogloeopsis fritschii TaxID=1124 RepID=UPI0019F3A806|nr:penicillin-binding protein 1C [Chlorogloeopsis fritschii]MBF2005694.1 penicillin-binding protein 1C [Chlorogloeopsis fritschii C42_A2020_084]
MKQAKKWLLPIKQKVWHQPNRRTSKIILALLLICLLVRLLPYFAPIHAADIAQEQLALEFSDRNGLPLGTILTSDREHTSVVPLNQVSPQFIHAILAAEDGDFYHHGALDLKAAARALKDSIQAKRIVSGASTITMQLARMLDSAPRNLSGKVREIWLSWRLAAGMNKDEILSAYINRLPMGGNIYGVEAAARTYFSIPASDLNLAQASLLAAIPNNPTYFDPLQHWERLKQRQKYVLNRMAKDGYITKPIVECAYAEKVSFQSRQRGIVAAPHFLFWLTSTPPRKRGGVAKPGWASPIRTTIDRPLQQFVEAQLQQVLSSLAANNVHHAAALVVDNHTGEVLAYVGSPDYFNEAKLGRNDGVQALRQPGSTLKPFLYEMALEKGVIRPNTILADVPTNYAIPGAKLYSPTDYTKSFLGPVRVRIALANSLNIPAVRVLEKLGVQTFLARLRELGFENLNQSAEYYGLGLTLGSGEVSLWELARAYVIMARQGQPIQLVTALNDQKGHGDISSPRVSSPSTWQLITDMLSDNHARATAFGVDSVLNLPFPAAVKTGTSSNFRDTWTVGFTTDYTVATWVGNFDGAPMRQVSGVTGAAPLWNRIMLHLHEHKEPATFSLPEGMVQLPICAFSGLKPTQDCASVVQEYFYPKDISVYANQDNFDLSSEYDEWLARQNQSSFTSDRFKILSPHNGDFFLLYPGEEAQQKLEFKLAGISTQPVEWWLNGKKIATQSTNSLFWQLHPGKWTLEARSGEMSDKVTFQVELASKKPTRRGFSIGNSKVGNN